jgi:hypothetical protein
MPPASATQKLKDVKKGNSRASSVVSKPDPESPSSESQESNYLKELQKYVCDPVNLSAWLPTCDGLKIELTVCPPSFRTLRNATKKLVSHCGNGLFIACYFFLTDASDISLF